MIETLNDYQREVLRTLDNPQKATAPRELFVACMALGLAGEAGEVADLLKKELWHAHPPNREKLIKELGDVLWYVTAVGHLNGIALETVANANAEKLRARYPNGFSTEASQHRKE